MLALIGVYGTAGNSLDLVSRVRVPSTLVFGFNMVTGATEPSPRRVKDIAIRQWRCDVELVRVSSRRRTNTDVTGCERV